MRLFHTLVAVVAADALGGGAAPFAGAAPPDQLTRSHTDTLLSYAGDTWHSFTAMVDDVLADAGRWGVPLPAGVTEAAFAAMVNAAVLDVMV